jgi:hypothetical protein
VLDCTATEHALGARLPEWEGQLRQYVATGTMAETGLGRVAA